MSVCLNGVHTDIFTFTDHLYFHRKHRVSIMKTKRFILPQQIVVMSIKGNIQPMEAQRGSTGIGLLFL